ncbi:hypothetical protein V6R21_10965 [Limibacter armeniacum]|uniref:helix-turn-helix domain-containing protein n=1 Tax=Limibacter armeniacum TaxID=466084 RepID=UPI002FE5C905
MTDNQEEKINDRIVSIIKALDLSKKSFANSIGISPQTLQNIVGARKTSPAADVISSIITQYDIVNPEWLLTGRGEMLKKEVSSSKVRIRGEGNTIASNVTGNVGADLSKGKKLNSDTEILLYKSQIENLQNKITDLQNKISDIDIQYKNQIEMLKESCNNQLKAKDEMIELLKSMLQK